MPALPPAFGRAKIIVKQNQNGVNIFNVLHAGKTALAPWTSSELSSLASAVRAAWVTNVIPRQASSLTLTDVVCQDLSSDSGPEATATGSTAGTGVGVALPANAAVCWSWKIARRYRGGHPRTYIGGMESGALSNANTITSTAQGQHATAAAAIRTAINGVAVADGTAVMVSISYFQNNALRSEPQVDIITGVSVDTRIDSQRRRLGRDR